MKAVAAALGALALFVGGALTAMADDGSPTVTTDSVTTATTQADTTTTATTTAVTTTTATTTTTPTTTWHLTWPPPAPPKKPTTTAAKTPPKPVAPPPPPARFILTGSVTPSAGVTIGSTVDYTYSVWNTGSQAATATLTDLLPPQLIPIEADAGQGSCSGTQSVSCSLGSIAAGQTVVVTIATQVGQVGSSSNAVKLVPGDPSIAVSAVGPIVVAAADATPVKVAPATPTKASRRK